MKIETQDGAVVDLNRAIQVSVDFNPSKYPIFELTALLFKTADEFESAETWLSGYSWRYHIFLGDTHFISRENAWDHVKQMPGVLSSCPWNLPRDSYPQEKHQLSDGLWAYKVVIFKGIEEGCLRYLAEISKKLGIQHHWLTNMEEGWPWEE